MAQQMLGISAAGHQGDSEPPLSPCPVFLPLRWRRDSPSPGSAQPQSRGAPGASGSGTQTGDEAETHAQPSPAQPWHPSLSGLPPRPAAGSLRSTKPSSSLRTETGHTQQNTSVPENKITPKFAALASTASHHLFLLILMATPIYSQDYSVL